MKGRCNACFLDVGMFREIGSPVPVSRVLSLLCTVLLIQGYVLWDEIYTIPMRFICCSLEPHLGGVFFRPKHRAIQQELHP